MRIIPLFLLLALCGCAAQPVAKIAPVAAAPSVVVKPMPPAPPQVSMFADAFDAPLQAQMDLPVAITPPGPLALPPLMIYLSGQCYVTWQAAPTPQGPWTDVYTETIELAIRITSWWPEFGPTNYIRAKVF